VLRHVVKALCHLLLYSWAISFLLLFSCGLQEMGSWAASKIAAGMHGQWGLLEPKKKATRAAREIFALAEREIN
jgi:hypothetical protein